MSREDLYQEALRDREDELMRQGKNYGQAIEIAKRQVLHDHADPPGEEDE